MILDEHKTLSFAAFLEPRGRREHLKSYTLWTIAEPSGLLDNGSTMIGYYNLKVQRSID